MNGHINFCQTRTVIGQYSPNGYMSVTVQIKNTHLLVALSEVLYKLHEVCRVCYDFKIKLFLPKYCTKNRKMTTEKVRKVHRFNLRTI